jgi:hypothetical protein
MSRPFFSFMTLFTGVRGETVRKGRKPPSQ